jgi:hypothetical protein
VLTALDPPDQMIAAASSRRGDHDMHSMLARRLAGARSCVGHDVRARLRAMA